MDYVTASRPVSSDQVIVLLLLAAAFAAGWFARGGRPERRRSSAAAGGAPASEAHADAEPGPDPLLTEADETLRRALTAARAARAVALGPAGASPVATESALRVLDRRLGELEAFADRLETERGVDDEAFTAFDRAVSSVAAARRRIDGEGDLDGLEAAQAEWERAARAS